MVDATVSLWPDSEMPGRLVTDGQTRWEGPITWRRHHGNGAESQWLLGHLSGFTGALLDDGTRGNAFRPYNPEVQGWRRSDGEGGWIAGRVEISDYDIRFMDVEPILFQAYPKKSLLRDILESRELREAAADSEFAVDLYGGLCSIVWLERSTRRETYGHWLKAAKLVADIRGLGECYTDYMEMGNEGDLTVEIEAMLGRIGYEPFRKFDRASQSDRTAALVKRCEERPVGPIPAWYARQWGHGLQNGDTIEDRMHACAASGRATIEEWFGFWETWEPSESAD